MNSLSIQNIFYNLKNATIYNLNPTNIKIVKCSFSIKNSNYVITPKEFILFNTLDDMSTYMVDNELFSKTIYFDIYRKKTDSGYTNTEFGIPLLNVREFYKIVSFTVESSNELIRDIENQLISFKYECNTINDDFIITPTIRYNSTNKVINLYEEISDKKYQYYIRYNLYNEILKFNTKLLDFKYNIDKEDIIKENYSIDNFISFLKENGMDGYETIKKQ